jgi:hypothetical protein
MATAGDAIVRTRGRVVRQATYWGWERALGFAEFDCEPPG